MTFVGKSEKCQLFEDLFYTIIKMQPVMTANENYQFSFLVATKGIAGIQEYKLRHRQSLEDVLVIFRTIYQTGILSKAQMVQAHF